MQIEEVKRMMGQYAELCDRDKEAFAGLGALRPLPQAILALIEHVELQDARIAKLEQDAGNVGAV